MSKLSLRAVCSAILSLAAIATAPTASAAIITGSWDPVLPAPFVNLGWVATVNLGIADSCKASQSGAYFVEMFGTSFGCTAAPEAKNFDVLRAQVGLYSTLTGLIVEVLNFEPTTTMGVKLVSVVGTPATNDFVLNLDESSPESSTTPPGLKFKLAFPGALPVLYYQDIKDSGTYIAATGTPIVTRFDVQPDSERSNVLRDTALSVGQQAVPEPGSLALVLLALGAAGAVAGRGTRRAGCRV